MVGEEVCLMNILPKSISGRLIGVFAIGILVAGRFFGGAGSSHMGLV